MAMPTPPPLAISGTGLFPNTLPEPVKQLITLKVKADSLLASPALEAELRDGHSGQQSAAVRTALDRILEAGHHWPPKLQGSSKLKPDQVARGHYILGWALGRVGEYNGTKPEELPPVLERALQEYATAASLLGLPEPPALGSTPSVTRPKPGQALDQALTAEQPGWVGEMLAEYARTQTTLAFSNLLLDDKPIEEVVLAELLDLAARRNVQALFTPIEESSADGDSSSASTVLGNARLIKDVSEMYPFSPSPDLWLRRLAWATHSADVRFVQYSMQANRLVQSAEAAASTLRSSSVSEQTRNDVRGVLEATVRRLVPLEKAQGGVLLGLGRMMLSAVGSIYLGREEAVAIRRDSDTSIDEEEADKPTVEVPENDLVRETRQVLIRAAGLFENSYASFLRTPEKARTPRQEQRLLRRLESTYIELEQLDNGTPDVLELRAQRVERALWINARLVEIDALGIASDDESEDEEEESDEDELSRRMVRQARMD